MQILIGVLSIVAAVFVWMGTSAAVPTHPGGTDDKGCHAGSQPYHCHNGGDPATATNSGQATPGVPGSTAPVVEAPQAGAPDAAVPDAVMPVEPPPATGPVPPPPPGPDAQVQGIQETQQPTDSLARTGLTEDTYYLALGLLLAGMLLITTSGLVGHLPERTKGGFTFRTRTRSGDPVVVRITAPQR